MPLFHSLSGGGGEFRWTGYRLYIGDCALTIYSNSQ